MTCWSIFSPFGTLGERPFGKRGGMTSTRFTEEQMVRILRNADKVLVAEVAQELWSQPRFISRGFKVNGTKILSQQR